MGFFPMLDHRTSCKINLFLNCKELFIIFQLFYLYSCKQNKNICSCVFYQQTKFILKASGTDQIDSSDMCLGLSNVSVRKIEGFEGDGE